MVAFEWAALDDRRLQAKCGMQKEYTSTDRVDITHLEANSQARPAKR